MYSVLVAKLFQVCTTLPFIYNSALYVELVSFAFFPNVTVYVTSVPLLTEPDLFADKVTDGNPYVYK